MMEGVDLVERAVSAFNANDAAAFAAVFADDGIMIEYPDRVAARGRDAVREYIGGMFAAFPGAKVALLSRIDLGHRQITHEGTVKANEYGHFPWQTPTISAPKSRA